MAAPNRRGHKRGATRRGGEAFGGWGNGRASPSPKSKRHCSKEAHVLEGRWSADCPQERARNITSGMLPQLDRRTLPTVGGREVRQTYCSSAQSFWTSRRKTSSGPKIRSEHCKPLEAVHVGCWQALILIRGLLCNLLRELLWNLLWNLLRYVPGNLLHYLPRSAPKTRRRTATNTQTWSNMSFRWLLPSLDSDFLFQDALRKQAAHLPKPMVRCDLTLLKVSAQLCHASLASFQALALDGDCARAW